MKKLNLVKENVSFVLTDDKIYLSKPSENQNKILECENSIEIINKEINKTNKMIKENQKEIDEYAGKPLTTVIGFTVMGFLTGLVLKLVTGIDSISFLNNINILLFSTLFTVPVSIYTASIMTILKKKYIKENKILRNERNGYKKLLNIKETELRVLNIFDREIKKEESYDSINIIDTNRKDTIKQLKHIKEFYNSKTNSEYECTGIKLENNGLLILEKEKNKSKKLKK